MPTNTASERPMIESQPHSVWTQIASTHMPLCTTIIITLIKCIYLQSGPHKRKCWWMDGWRACAMIIFVWGFFFEACVFNRVCSEDMWFWTRVLWCWWTLVGKQRMMDWNGKWRDHLYCVFLILDYNVLQRLECIKHLILLIG